MKHQELIVSAPASQQSPARHARKPKKIAMRISSFCSKSKGELSDYLVLERPHGRLWTRTSESCLQERMESRPPLPSDLEGPTPCTYTVHTPRSAVHGTKISPRNKYDRDMLPNGNTQAWTLNLSGNGNKRPDPCSYLSPNVLGQHCPASREAPSFSITPRRATSMLVRPGAEKSPGPQSYDFAKALELTHIRNPSYTIPSRRTRTRTVPSPGPAHYHPLTSFTQHQSPSFTMRQRRTSTF